MQRLITSRRGRVCSSFTWVCRPIRHDVVVNVIFWGQLIVALSLRDLNHHPFIHLPFIYHPSTTHPSIIHPPSSYHPSSIHPPIIHHPCTIHQTSIHHLSIHYPSTNHATPVLTFIVLNSSTYAGRGSVMIHDALDSVK